MKRKSANNRWNLLSIRSQRSRGYLEAAFSLVTVIPMLCLCVIMFSLFSDILPDSSFLRVGVGTAGLLSGVAGFVMLRIYPKNLERLRGYLSRIAAEDLPEQATLLPGEQDFSDIEGFLNKIIGSLHSKILRLDAELTRTQQLLKTVESQSEDLIAAERQRVMIESLGAACHHIGQPTTVLLLYLTCLREQNTGIIDHAELEACIKAVESITSILKKLQHVSEYRTVPYASFRHEDGSTGGGQMKIVDIDSP